MTVGTVASGRQGLASNDSLEAVNSPNDNNMRISKVNIAVKPQAKNDGKDSD